MKKSLLIISLISIHALSYGQFFSLGGGFEYNMSTDNPGINLRGYYNIGDHFCFGPEFSYGFPHTITTATKSKEITVFEFNLNAHYIVEFFEEHLGAYPVFGINYTLEDSTQTTLATGMLAEETINFWGTNIGAGVHIPIHNVLPFIEYHYITGALGEHVLTVGILYTFGSSEH